MLTPPPEQNSCGLRLAAKTSSWRVRAKYPGPCGNGESANTHSSKNCRPGVSRSVRNTASR